jgi:hypothetical protein
MHRYNEHKHFQEDNTRYNAIDAISLFCSNKKMVLSLLILENFILVLTKENKKKQKPYDKNIYYYKRKGRKQN